MPTLFPGSQEGSGGPPRGTIFLQILCSENDFFVLSEGDPPFLTYQKALTQNQKREREKKKRKQTPKKFNQGSMGLRLHGLLPNAQSWGLKPWGDQPWPTLEEARGV